ncbi:MAG: hypothetical protein ACTS6P_00340 [Candidatus Hodgkinia cicadicola]
MIDGLQDKSTNVHGNKSKLLTYHSFDIYWTSLFLQPIRYLKI